MPPTWLYSKRYSILQEPDLGNTSGGKRQRLGKLKPYISILWHRGTSRNPPYQDCGFFYAHKMEVRSMEPPKLLVQDVSKIYKDGRKTLPTLTSIDLQVKVGEFVTVIGPSGCGKSTLFNIVAGVDQPTTGLVAIDGDSSSMRTGKAGYMPQQPLLLPWRTVEENVMLGLDVRHVPRK